MKARTLKEFLERAVALGKKKVCVAAAADEEVLQAVKEARDCGFLEPVLVGAEEEIREQARKVGLSLAGVEVVDVPDAREAALEAVRLVRAGRAHVLMKGLVNTTDFMRAVLHPEFGLRTGKLLSHLAVFEVPGWERLIFNTDGGINVAPDLEQKVAIIENAVQFLRRLGWEQPRVALLAASEVINPKVPATVDAALIAKMAAAGQIRGAVVDGPMALDVAVSEEAARHKGIASPVAGEAELLVNPTVEVGNVFGKALIYFAGARMAGVVLGASVPIVLTSRASSAEEKLYSLAVAALGSSREAPTCS